MSERTLFQINGPLYFNKMLCDIDSAITWKIIRMASYLTEWGCIFCNISAALVKKTAEHRSFHFHIFA